MKRLTLILTASLLFAGASFASSPPVFDAVEQSASEITMQKHFNSTVEFTIVENQYCFIADEIAIVFETPSMKVNAFDTFAKIENYYNLFRPKLLEYSVLGYNYLSATQFTDFRSKPDLYSNYGSHKKLKYKSTNKKVPSRISQINLLQNEKVNRFS